MHPHPLWRRPGARVGAMRVVAMAGIVALIAVIALCSSAASTSAGATAGAGPAFVPTVATGAGSVAVHHAPAPAVLAVETSVERAATGAAALRLLVVVGLLAVALVASRRWRTPPAPGHIRPARLRRAHSAPLRGPPAFA